MKQAISTLKEFIRENYISAKLLYQYKLQKSGIATNPIVIYQMGKVGSTSILHSLQALNSFPSIYQVHTLSDRGILAMEKRYWGNTPTLFRKSLLPETTHVFVSHFLKSQLIKDTHIKWKLITLVRDPIARNVSEFFYSVDTTKNDPHLPDFYNRYRTGNIKTSELIDRFFERFSENSDEYAVPLNWFKEEVLNVIGVDVYSEEFPRSRGFQIIESQNKEVLILKLEMLKDCYNQAFYEFLKIDNFRLITSNTANKKDYHVAYKNFIDEVNLPVQYVSKIYDSKYVRHFYSDQEVDQFIKKWCKA